MRRARHADVMVDLEKNRGRHIRISGNKISLPLGKARQMMARGNSAKKKLADRSTSLETDAYRAMAASRTQTS